MNKLEVVELQISELEMLFSIYPNDNEIVVQDLDVFSTMKQFVESGGNSYVPKKKLPLTLFLQPEEVDSNIELQCILPLDYPLFSYPEVFIRCNNMTRHMQTKYNEDLSKYISTIQVGEACLYQVAQWALENYLQYANSSVEKANTNSEDMSELEDKSQKYLRLWIYSHHIYNKEKRKSILEWAKELELTGFSMPGKPGIVCVEGMQRNCEEYWQRLRRQTWKRLSIVHKEECIQCEQNWEDFRKFKCAVAEIDFGVHGGRDYHMDLGKFLDYLIEHDSRDMFQVFFGVAGKSTDKT